MIIAVDGPAAAGKGTLSRKIADHFKLHYLDTGRLYRAIGQKVLAQNGNPENVADAVAAAKALNPEDLSGDHLRTVKAGKIASIVAQYPQVREEMLHFQRRFAAQPPGAVLDGRDIGTVVCPDADVKLFVTADVRERARRRQAEIIASGTPADFDTILGELQDRDKRDREREVAPLKPAADAHLLDTSKLDIETAFQMAVDIINGI